MATGKEEAKFSIPIETNAKTAAKESADALEQLRSRIAASVVSIGELNSAQRRLVGSSAEVVKARTELKAKIAAEKDKLSGAQVALLKSGTTYEQLTAKLKAKTEAQKNGMTADDVAKARATALGNAVKLAGGPVSSLKERLGALKDIAGEGGAGGAMSYATYAAAGLTAAIGALVVASAAGVVALAKWVITGADAARSAGLLREAALGSAEQAKNLGTQVDALSRKIATPKEKINELAVSLSKTRLSGTEIVNTLNLVGQASEAMGDSVGSALGDIVKRSQVSQRLFISPQELFGTGLEFKDVAGALAKQMGVGVGQAQKALLEGRVKLEDGAKALRTAVEKRFGDVNLKKVVSLPALATKAKERLGELTANVKLDRLLEPMGKFLDLLDGSTVTGSTLKKIVTLFGDSTVTALTKAIPIAKKFFQGLIIGALEAYLAFLKLRKQFRDTFGDTEVLKGVDAMTIAFQGARIAVWTVATGLGIAAGAVLLLVGAFKLAGKWSDVLAGSATSAYKAIATTDWKGLGTTIVDGFLNGILAGPRLVEQAVGKMGEAAKRGFKLALGIASPSKVFREFGKFTVQGYTEGVVDHTADAKAAMVEAAAPPQLPAGSLGAAGGGGRGDVTITIPINITGAVDEEAARKTADTFEAQFRDFFKRVISGAGGAAPAGGTL